MSPYEVVQTIIGINLLIVTIVGVCLTAFKNDNKK
ncbi:putative holin-like toxin [Gemella haemolysans]|nr:putative holin-like toxin [Gemella haemolysans]UBH82342.1 putative holin-like toxin [Gemella haemolysans]